MSELKLIRSVSMCKLKNVTTHSETLIMSNDWKIVIVKYDSVDETDHNYEKFDVRQEQDA